MRRTVCTVRCHDSGGSAVAEGRGQLGASFETSSEMLFSTPRRGNSTGTGQDLGPIGVLTVVVEYPWHQVPLDWRIVPAVAGTVRASRTE